MNERRHDPTSFGDGRYPVQRRLGAGNFATVYLAFDERLDVPVAVKLLADHWSWDPEVRGRFVDEARMLRSINDPRVVQIRDIAETDDGRPYLVMDYATEGTLEERLIELAHRGDRPSPTELREFVAEAGAALAVLHGRRIAHRDLKPSNLLITRDPSVIAAHRRPDGLLRPGERLLLGDLGLAKDLRAGSGVTVGVGTAGYMAPEQSGPGTRIDTRTDLYALSALVSQVATGEVPDPLRRYSDGTVESGRPLPAAIGGSFRGALEHGLDQDPEKRPQTVEAWVAEVDAGLAELASSPPTATAPPTLEPAGTPSDAGRAFRRRAVFLAIAAVTVLAVAFAVVASGGGDEDDAAATSAAPATSVDTTTSSTSSTSTSTTTSTTTTTTVAVTTVALVPFVQITGPVEIPANTAQRWWEVSSSGVAYGTWELRGAEGVIPLNLTQWLPGDGFQASLTPGTYTLELTAFDAAGNEYTAELTFVAV